MKNFFTSICVSGIIFSSVVSTFAANEINIILAENPDFTFPKTQSVEYTVDQANEENMVNLGEILQEELAKAGTILKLITEPLPTGFIFDVAKNILNISKDEATAGKHILNYEICRDKPTGLNDLEFKAVATPPNNGSNTGSDTGSGGTDTGTGSDDGGWDSGNDSGALDWE